MVIEVVVMSDGSGHCRGGSRRKDRTGKRQGENTRKEGTGRERDRKKGKGEGEEGEGPRERM
jgi:hypothetical protein